ncbi:MAG TPA: hypothetical protein VGI74_01020 [Streptosporangiaceae bacterium]
MLAFQFLDPLALDGDGLAAGRLPGQQPVGHHLPDFRRALLIEPDVPLPVLHGFGFDDFHWHEGLGTRVLPLLPANAVEVRVQRPGVAAREADTEPRTAVAAEQPTLQVVRSLLGLLAGLLPSSHDGLHGLEGGLIDQRLMPSGVEHAFVADHAEVVAVAQHVVDRVLLHRPS